MKPQSIFRLLLLTAITISANSQVQTKKGKLLDVYKIDFGYYIKETEPDVNNPVAPMLMEQKRMEKADWKPLTVYAHPEYLYAEDVLPEGEKTTWQIQYKTKRLMELRGKMAYPMNFDGFLSTDVYTAEEEIKDNTSGYGRIIFSDDTMTVAGNVCKQAIIRYWTKEGGADTNEGETTIWYCPQLPRFYLPGYEYLQKIPGMALLILNTFETRGIKAKTVVKQQKPVSFFDVPKGVFVMYPPKAN